MYVSIITVCFNAEKTIENTLNSILNQTYKKFEYIIIDGKSSDNTTYIIKKYLPLFKSKNIPVVYISEKDRGIYDAMNKGIDIASGVWINFMNADDTFCNSHVLQEIFVDDYEDVDVLYGNTYLINNGKRVLKKPDPLETLKYDMPFCHQASFVRKELLKKYYFDTQYSICADYHFFLTLYMNKKRFKYVDIAISDYNLNGFSGSNIYEMFKERMKIRSCFGLINEKSLSSKMQLKYCYFKQVIKWVLRKVFRKYVVRNIRLP